MIKSNLDATEFVKANPDWNGYVDLILFPPNAEEVADEFPDSEGSEVTRDERTCIQPNVTRLAFYFRLRKKGEPHRFAEMLALQSAPCLMTDSVFFAGMKCAGDSLDKRELGQLVAAAKQQGYTPPQGAYYMPSLAAFKGDKRAWVSHSDGRGYVKKLCEERGWACEGAVSVKARESKCDPHDNCVPLADDIVNRLAKEKIAADPSLKKKSRRELREKIIAEHGPSK